MVRTGQKPSPDQLGFFDEPEPLPEVERSYRELLVEQIKRDFQTLCLEPNMIDPSPEFYKDRIRLYREAVKAL